MIVQRYVTHYRVPFFDALRSALRDRGVILDLVHGFPAQDSKRDTVEVPWAITVTNRWLGVGSKRVLWQPALPHVADADLVIVEQASARALNYLLFVRQLRGRTRLAFWGHGKNFKEERASGPGELVKRVMSRRVHWWFAYNAMAAGVVRGLGYPRERITDVQNAIDTRELVRAREALTDAELAALRSELRLVPGRVGLYVGGMYREKRLDYLIEASSKVRELLPDFSLVLIGAGPEAEVARTAASTHSWVHYLGPRFGREKVPYLAAGDALLMPGLVGLAILDSFALGMPLVTTADGPHSPEIDYLISGRNGVMLPAATTPDRYGREVVRLLQDEQALTELREGCRESAQRYTVEEMAARFASGVMAALQAPPLP